MKNKALYIGMALVVLALVCAACQNGVQDVKMVYDKAPSAEITMTKTTDGNYLILSWDAVEDASWYTLYAEKEGQKTFEQPGNGSPAQKYATADGAPSANDDPNRWYARIGLTGQYAPKAGNYRFGVRVWSVLPNTYGSDIEWSDWYTQP
jgi:hypothetical protein